jgi:GNAT superfamily N-acetyltransferase
MTDASHDHGAPRIDAAWSHVDHLPDGTEITVRMLRPDDREAFLAGFERLSPESRYARFFTAVPRLPEAVLQRLLNPDGIDHVALAAWRSVDGTPVEPLGVARFVRIAGTETAEAAVAVVDHMQRRGLGTLLLMHLAEAARERGIRRFRAEVMRSNQAVNGLLHDLDAEVKPVSVDGNLAVYEIDLGQGEGAPADGLVFRMLRLVARGLEVLVGRLS